LTRRGGAELFDSGLTAHQRLGGFREAADLVDPGFLGSTGRGAAVSSGGLGGSVGAISPAVVWRIANPAHPGAGARLGVLVVLVARSTPAVFLDPGDPVGGAWRPFGVTAVILLEPRLGFGLAAGVGGEAGRGGAGPGRRGGGQMIVVQRVDVPITERVLSTQAGEGVQVAGSRRGGGGFEPVPVDVHLEQGGVSAAAHEAVGDDVALLAGPQANVSETFGSQGH